MNRLFAILAGTACACAIGVPAAAALTSGQSDDRPVPARSTSSTVPKHDDAVSRAIHKADNAVAHASRTTEPGDDHGRHVEAGDDHGRHTETGDDHGRRGGHGSDD